MNTEALSASNLRGSLTFSVREFCDTVGISRATFYKMAKNDAAPPVIRLGGRVLILKETADTWLKSLEK